MAIEEESKEEQRRVIREPEIVGVEENPPSSAGHDSVQICL